MERETSASLQQLHGPELSALCDPILDPLFWRAERFGTSSAWWGHVPFAFWLTRITRPRLLVELGTHSGVSYSAFCEAVVRERLDTRCFAVDTWRGDEHSGFYNDDVFQQLRSFHDERYGRFSMLLRSSFDEAVGNFDDFSVDLLHIDGLHTYEAVRHDFETWRPKLSDRAVVLMHDISERQGDFGVWRFWAELRKQFPSFDFPHGHGLGVLAVGRNIPPAVASLFSLTDPLAIATIRERFAFAGERWAGEMHERWLNEMRELNARNELQIRDARFSNELQIRDARFREETAELREAARAEALARIEVKNRLDTEKIRAKEQAETFRREVSALRAKMEVARYQIVEARRHAETEALHRETAETQALRLRAETQALRLRAETQALRLQAETQALRLQAAEARARAYAQLVASRARDLAPKSEKITWRTLLRRGKKFRDQPESAEGPALVAGSSLFDASWYREQYPDVAAADIDPAFHYVTQGAAEGRNPGPRFDGNWYLENYSDVAGVGQNPLLHYLMFGEKEGREIRPVTSEPCANDQDPEQLSTELVRTSSLFDASWYREQYADVAAAEIDPAFHYVTQGAAEGRNPAPYFDGKWYLENHADVAAAGLNPLLHYLRYGAAEGREIRAVPLPETDDPTEQELLRQLQLVADSSLFDVGWYEKQYPDVLESGTNTLLHYLTFGAAEGRNPGPNFDGNFYLRRYPDVAEAGLNPLVHYLDWGPAQGREIRPVTDTAGEVTAHDLLQAHYSALKPIPTYLIPRAPKRLTIVTDSINAGSLYGGVGTALILSTLVARRAGATLRLVTRTEQPQVCNFAEILSTNGIRWSDSIEFFHSSPQVKRDLAVSENDFFLTTSWWTTRCLQGAVDKRRIIYLLQEDERMFYPFGDERLRCRETLADPDLQFVINSELLFDHLTTGPDALLNIKERGVWFEPAFPAAHYYPEMTNGSSGRKNSFFFYARPQNLRNLYWRGLEAITAAIEEGFFPADDWDFYFVGRCLEKVILPGGIRPTILENLPWAEYAALVRRMDVGLCLMDTPHPSYPPLDLAASGAVVVTNRHGLKTSLTRYSENILCADPTVAGLKNEIGHAVKLAGDSEKRFARYSRNRIPRDWAIALESVVARLALKFEEKEA